MSPPPSGAARKGAFSSLSALPAVPVPPPAARGPRGGTQGDLFAIVGGMDAAAPVRRTDPLRVETQAMPLSAAYAVPLSAANAMPRSAVNAFPRGEAAAPRPAATVLRHPAAQRPAPAVVASARIELINVRREALAMARLRALWVLLAFVAIALLALFRIAYLGFGEASHPVGDDSLLPDRGEITDRNGVPLASDFPAYSLWFNPKAMEGVDSPLIKTPAEVADALVRIFPDMNRADLVRRLSPQRIACTKGDKGKHCTGFVGSYLKRRIMPEDANRIHALGEPALEFPRENERFYPQGSMAASVLGFVGADPKTGKIGGRVGMEQVYDHVLTDPDTRGTAQALSIDSRVQGALEDEIARGMGLSGAKAGAGVVLDVDTGEVLALASLPAFNPNLIDQAGVANIFNRVTNEVYELGSVIKPITIATAIESGVVTNLAKRYPAVPFMIDNKKIYDHESYGATLDVPEALIHSSNIVTAEIADQVGPHRLEATMRQLHFNQRPYIELPARGMPLWQKGDRNGDWSRISAMTISYGHGMSVTPLHLACAYAALVNGGIWRPATLKKIDPAQAPAGTRIWSDSTSARMRQLLRAIVVTGTGRHADAPGFRIGGKTGTAEQWDGHVYRKDINVTTFAAAFPMDHPRYVVVVTLNDPQGTAATSGQRTAAWNAAPVVGRVVPRIGPLLGVMPDTTHDIDISDITPLIANGDGE